MAEKADVLLAEQTAGGPEAAGGGPSSPDDEAALPDSEELRALIARAASAAI